MMEWPVQPGIWPQMILTITNTPINITPVSPLCSNNQSITLNATPTNGVWTGYGINETNSTPNIAEHWTTYHSYLYTNWRMCIGTQTIQITVSGTYCFYWTWWQPYVDDPKDNFNWDSRRNIHCSESLEQLLPLQYWQFYCYLPIYRC